MITTQNPNSGLACNSLKTFQTPNMGSAQKVIRTNLSSLHNSLRIAQILSVTVGYPQKKKDSVAAVFIQLYANYISLRGSVTNYPNTIGSVQRLPDDIGLVQYSNHVNDVHSVQPFGSMPSLSNSFRPRFLSQLAKLIFDCFAAASNCSFSSGVILILNCGDCPSPLGLLSLLIVDKWPPIKLTLLALGGYNITVIPKKAMPRGALTLTGHLTTNDNLRIEEAMKDHITPVTGRNSFTPNIKFLWRFFSCQQSRYFTVEARSEQEARSMLPDAPCLFSARIRQGVNHV